MSVEENEGSSASSINMDNLTPHADNLVCESCFSDTVLEGPGNIAPEEIPGNAASVKCTNPECGYEGYVVVQNGEITELGGDIFHGDDHNGYREEPNVTYRENYKLDTGEDAPTLEDDNPAAALTYTNNDILGGFDPEVNYNCSCGLQFYSKNELAQHLLAVKHNQDQKQASKDYIWGEQKEELAEMVEQSVEKMEEEDLSPRDWEVCVDEGELWMNVWFESDPEETLQDRKSKGMYIFRNILSNTDTNLPAIFNVGYQENTQTDEIACWWSSAEQ